MARPKYEKYNIESWKNKSEKVLVQRDKLGHFIHWELFYAYRCSRGLTGERTEGIPMHSTPNKPNYYGFTIFAYATKPEYLNDISEKLKEKLKKLVHSYLHFSWKQLTDGWISDYIGWEAPVRKTIDKNMLHTWEFIAENNGKTVYTDSGNLEEL
jgi:hypothetical protein